jgi:enoyl-CoA hydratase
VTAIVEDGITTVHIDHGKVNAFDAALIRELHSAVSDASSQRALILTGKPGVLTGGLDTKALVTMTGQQRESFFVDFGRLILGIWLTPIPVVCAASGHAVAAGTLLALASDHVIAARGDYRWGMTEARIGLELSDYAIMLVRNRVAPPDADRLLLQGVAVDPEAAVALGLAHESTDGDDVLARAGAVARLLAALPREVYARNKERLRMGPGHAALASLSDDIRRLVASAAVDWTVSDG